MHARTAAGAAVALMLGACATEQGPTAPTPLPQSDVTGRWMLAAPNAPPCGMEFEGAPGQTQGTINPDGGCPGNFYTSRNWTFTLDTLHSPSPTPRTSPWRNSTVRGEFTGQSTTGLPITLSR